MAWKEWPNGGRGEAEMMGGMALWMLLWALAGIGVLVLAVIGVVVLVRGADRRQLARPLGAGSAEEELRRRYAAGEIDEDEFFRRQAGLS